MSDFRLQAFYAVAKNLSFTKASQELFISQPAITKHINKLENDYQVRLFERQGNHIELTKAGKIMLQHCEKILYEYNQMEYAMHLLNNECAGQLRLGASTTISQYILPPILASFIDDFPLANITLINGNSHDIEHALTEHNIDLGLVEGVSHRVMLSYTPFYDDELIILTGAKSCFAKNDYLTLEQFKQAPLVLRERGSGTLETVEKSLAEHHLKLTDLNVRIYLGITEAIKLFMQNSDSICILSKETVQYELKNNLLKQLKVQPLSFKRHFSFVQSQGPQSALVLRFMNFIQEKYQNQANSN